MQLMSRKDAEALMTGPRPGSPQSTGSPGTPQQTSALRHDFLRADLTPLDDIPPLKSDPAHSVPDQTLTGERLHLAEAQMPCLASAVRSLLEDSHNAAVSHLHQCCNAFQRQL